MKQESQPAYASRDSQVTIERYLCSLGSLFRKQKTYLATGYSLSLSQRVVRPTTFAVSALLLSTGIQGIAEIIPTNRRMNWSPGVTVGVPGGIPNRTAIFVNVRTTSNSIYRCKGDGVTNDAPKLKAALLACPAGKVVYVPAGTYNLATDVTVVGATHQNYTLRGDGMGQTIFLLNGGKFAFGYSEYPYPSTGLLPVTSGATTGSTVLKLADATTVNAGNLVTLVMDTPPWMHSLTKQTQVFKMMFKVVSKTGTSVTITPPVPIDLSPYNPQIIPWGNAGDGTLLTQGVGLEGFTVDALGKTGFPIKLAQAWGCWLKNIEIKRTTGRQFYFSVVNASEVRECYTRATQGEGPNHEGMDFAHYCCWNLVEDNICIRGGAPAIVLGDAGKGACVGNVVAYNYADKTNQSLSVSGMCFSDSHGAGGNMLNLWEGNVGHGLHSDGYFGSSSRTTIARNYLHTTREPHGNSMAQIAVSLNHYANYINVVGNVLGTKDDLLYYDSEARPVGYKKLVWRLGYPNSGNSNYDTTDNLEGTANPAYGGYRTLGPTTPGYPGYPDYTASPNSIDYAKALDLNVKNTIIRHGNYDFAILNSDGSSKIPGMVWETDDARGTGVDFNDHNIPASYYTTKAGLEGRGVVWGSLAFPPIRPEDPAASTTPGVIPAWYRYIKGKNP